MNIKQIIFGCSLFFVSFFSFATTSGPLLVVVLMVKNEEAVIAQTLESYCQADPQGKYISYVVYDTGLDSWSPTMQRAQELFDRYHLTNYFILQEPFVDFSTSRNKALRLAEQRFPDAIFMLMPDAEWYLQNTSDLLKFCMDQVNQVYLRSYLVRILSSGTELDFYSGRLIRVGWSAYFEGVVHECLHNDNDMGMVPSTIYFNYPEKPAGMEASKKRWMRDRELLFKEYLKNPEDSRNLFYLAQTCDCLGDTDNAYYYYTKRTQLKGFVEEDFIAQYRLGILVERLIGQDASYTWALALQHYINAFLMRPTRVEPLVRVAAFYINHDIYDLAFLYSYIACNTPYPKDVLFVEKNLYDKSRYEIFAKSAQHVELEIPKKMCVEARERNGISVENQFLSMAFPF